jgi:8-oxo-dGTP pyrophosphatase MutT (NUDIX family)
VVSTPAVPRPAATIVLLRDARPGLEVLLLRRSPHAGFAPGAFVFPGGVVDPEDSAADTLDRIDGWSADAAAARLELVGAAPPAIAYYVAAIREAFEETGILLGACDAVAETSRRALLDGRVTFRDVLSHHGCRIRAGELEYFAHWITPERSPRRYDTRFFAARVPSGAHPVVDEREMTEARWIQPEAAVRAYAAGSLPMILPTIRTLERLAAFPNSGAALVAFASEPVPIILPGPQPGGFAGSVP